MSAPFLLFAQEPIVVAPLHWHPDSMAAALMATAAFGLVGTVVLAFGFELFGWITPRLDIEAKLTRGNPAVAAVVAALLIGLSWIIVRSMS